MSNDFEKQYITDFGQKLSHLEGILGAYLPRRIFDAEVQQKTIDCNKFTFSRLRSGQRKAANWELGRFIELFELAQYGFDYRLFQMPFDAFSQALEQAGIGSHGATAAHRLREALRSKVAPGAEIKVERDRRLNVGGIGGFAEEPGLVCLTPRDRVTVTVPLHSRAGHHNHLLVLHDFPGGRATSCLMPSLFAPETGVTGASIRLPVPDSGYLSFPVAGTPGYRCIYGIQCAPDLIGALDLRDPADGVVEIRDQQIVLLVDYLTNARSNEQAPGFVSFGEYLLK